MALHVLGSTQLGLDSSCAAKQSLIIVCGFQMERVYSPPAPSLCKLLDSARRIYHSNQAKQVSQSLS